MDELHIQHVGGAVAKVADDETAFGNRSASYVLNVLGRSPQPEGFAESVEWARGVYGAVEPYTAEGTYTNFMSAGDDRVKEAYGAQKYARLQALKDRYDPTNLFRLNQNVKPTKDS